VLVTIAGKHRGADSQIAFCMSDILAGKSLIGTRSALVIIACNV
jgi:hypothetical protein